MTLSKHVDAEHLEEVLLKRSKKTALSQHEQYIDSYSANKSVPKYTIPEHSSSSDLIYDYLTEELSLDGIPTLNLASFVNTDVDETPLKLITKNIVKNLADNDEYPSLIEFQKRCVSILSNLWHAPYTEIDGLRVTHSIGTATTGSSEAVMLGGLALKKRWQEKQKAKGKSTENPNIIMASCVQVALEKFARYFDVENRLIRIDEESGHTIDTTKIAENVDENTIGIFVILGSTFTGAFEPVEQIAKILDKVEQERGIDVRIHVDGASGGFVAPFLYPHLKWDFAVDRVDSINTSGHKYGLTTAGLGWVIWRNGKVLPDSLKFSLDYLGGQEETFGLNFSRAGFPVIHQYYNFLTYGREGYCKIFQGCLSNARLFSNFLEKSSYFEVLSVIHKPLKNPSEVYDREIVDDSKYFHGLDTHKYHPGLPVVAWRFSKTVRDKYPEIPQSIFSLLLRNKGYIVPNYHLPPDEHEKEILRVVVRHSMSLNLLDKLMQDCVTTAEYLIGACENARSIVRTQAQSAEEEADVVYKVLLSLAANGLEDLDSIQQTSLQRPGKVGTVGFRSTC